MLGLLTVYMVFDHSESLGVYPLPLVVLHVPSPIKPATTLGP